MLFRKVGQIIFWLILLAALTTRLLQPGGVRAMRLLPPTEVAAISKTQPAALPAGQADPTAKIEPALLQEIAAAGQADFFIWMVEKADLSAASRLKTKAEKGQFVFDRLRQTAETSQRDLRQVLDRQKIRYQSFYIANKILVFGASQSQALSLAARPDVARITANHTYQLEHPKVTPGPAHIAAVEPNLTFINADQVWAMGITGQGTVLAGNDTGLSWDHSALIDHYRGWNGTTVDHNYNWWDATGTYPTVPGDGYGHGTHISGIMVGDDGSGNQIGVAPGAKTIHCKNMDDGGGGNDATFIECFQWDLAPWNLDGTDPRPDLAPDAINNSWGYAGNYPEFEDEIAALQAAGIVVEVSAGNEGPGCQTLRSPGDYLRSLTTGSVNHAGEALPGLLTDFSSRGPSSLYPADYFPTVMAPGEDIRSSVPGNSYEFWSGTSMAGPHTTGLVGLLWAASPALRGRVEETAEILRTTAVPLTGQGGSDCGGDYSVGPNNDWGHGTIDAMAAVQQALLAGDVGTLAGLVTDGADPLPGATIRASLSPTMSWQTSSDLLGAYALVVLSGTHTVEASKYGYNTTQISGVSVMSGTTTTLNINLSPADSYTVSGFVTDSVTGWPLYASLGIEGYPGDPIWNDPVTGFYSVTLAADINYTFNVNAWSGGYNTTSRAVGPLAGNQNEDFGLTVNPVACSAPGYTLNTLFSENFESGLANWMANGLWNLEDEADTCGALVAPFPSSSHAAYYGLDDICTYNDGAANSGALTMVTPVTLPALGNPTLSIQSYEDTECGGDCAFDNRYIEISTDGGGNWLTLGEGYGHQFWNQQVFDLTPYLGNDILIRFRFDTVDTRLNDQFGWLVDNISIYGDCTPASGGLIVGNVYDLNTGQPLNNALVSSDTGQATTTDVTPGDPAVADGFYTLFSPAGPHTVTASLNSYGADVQTPTVIQDGVVWQDFNLPSGILAYAPSALAVTLDLGQTMTLPLTLANEGDVVAAFELLEINGSFTPLAQPASDLSTSPVQTKLDASSFDLSKWGKLPIPAARRPLNTSFPAVSSLPPIIDDPAGDASGVDVTIVEATSTSSEMLMRLNFNPGAGPLGVAGYIHLDTDQDPATGLPPEFLYGLPTQDIGFDYFLYLFNLPSSVDIYDADFNYLASVSPVYSGDALEFVIPLNVLGNDDGLIDVTMALGDFIGPTDWAPDVGHGTVSSGIPWLSEDPVSGTISPLADQPIAITFDAGAPKISQPGQYYAQLMVQDDTPYRLPPIPITMTVLAPANYGKLQGTVTGLAACDGPGVPLEDASILLQGAAAFSQTLATSISGTYEIWLDESNSPLTAMVSYPGYLDQTVTGINVTAGMTTTQDIDLRLNAPCLQVAPDSLAAMVELGQSQTLSLTLTNQGGGDLSFNLQTASLEAVLANLNLNYQTIIDAIPNRFDFDEGESGVSISDGGNDMYDDGNFLSTDLGGFVEYADNSVAGSPYFGSSGRYFTRKYPGLFVLAADMEQVDYFEISGNLGADGGGFVDSAVLETEVDGLAYYGFVKRVYAAGDPSVNHLIIVAQEPANDHIFDTYSDNDYHQVFNLSVNSRLYYLLYAGADGFYIDDSAALNIMNAFLNQISPSTNAPWLSFNPVTGLVPPDTVQAIDVTFDSSVVTQTGQYDAPARVFSNDPFSPTVEIPTAMTVISGGLVLEPATAVQSGDPGATVTYTLNLTNTSLAEDTFDLAAISQGWTSAVSATVGPLAAGAGEPVTVTVSIPLTAPAGAQNVTTLVATSQQDSSQSAQATLTTMANNFYRAVVTPTSSTRPGSPGAIISHTLWLTNSGNTTNTFHLSVSGNTWPIFASVGGDAVTTIISTEPLAPGAGDTISLLALIPAGAPIGATDTATVTVTSSQTSGPLATVTLTTVAALPGEQIYLPMVIKK